MQGKVSFDYSKAAGFVSEEELGYMKGLALAAKETFQIEIATQFS